MDSKDILRRVGERLNQKNEESKKEKTQLETERRNLVTSIGQDIVEAIMPYMQSMADRSQVTKEDIKAALSEVQINVPESNVHIPEFKIPTPQVTVNVPEMKIPEVRIPETKFPDRMSVGLENYSNKTPMPVMMVDTKGNPFQFTFPATSGGKQDFFTVKGITNTIGIVSINPDGSPAGAGSVASSVSVSDIFSTVGSNVINPDGRIKVELPTGSSGLTDTELRATSLTTQQLSGAIDSVSVTNTVTVTGTLTSTGAYLLNGDGTYRDSMPVTGTITGITNTIAAANVDSTGVQYSGSNPLPIYSANTLDVKQVSGSSDSIVILSGTVTAVTSITNTVAAMNVDSTGAGYSGSNPLPVTLISGALTSTISVGSVVADAVDDGSAPVQHGGIARTANPTAVAGNDVVKATYDDLGRQVMRPLQVRDLILTAYASVANGTETTLRAAVAGASLDMILLTLSNTSDAAVTADIRAVTAGNISLSIVVPPYGTAGYSASVPLPQSEQGNNWTIDLPDITGTTVYASALFSQEV